MLPARAFSLALSSWAPDWGLPRQKAYLLLMLQTGKRRATHDVSLIEKRRA